MVNRAYLLTDPECEDIEVRTPLQPVFNSVLLLPAQRARRVSARGSEMSMCPELKRTLQSVLQEKFFLHHGRLGPVVMVRQMRAFVVANEIHRGVVGKVALTYIPVVR